MHKQKAAAPTQTRHVCKIGSCIKRQLERREKIIPVGHARSVMLSVKFIFAARTGHSFVARAIRLCFSLCVIIIQIWERESKGIEREPRVYIYKKGGERERGLIKSGWRGRTAAGRNPLGAKPLLECWRVLRWSNLRSVGRGDDAERWHQDLLHTGRSHENYITRVGTIISS